MFNSGANLLTMTWQIKAWARERGLVEWVDRNQAAIDRMIRYALAFYGPASETQKKHRDQLNAMIKTGKQPLGIMLALYENLPANDSLYDHDLSYFTPGDWKDAFDKRKLPFSVGEVKLDRETEGVLWGIATAIHRKDASNFLPGVTVELLAEAFRVLSPFDPFWTKGMNGAKPHLLTASEWAKAANVQLPPIKGHKVSHTDAREEWAKEVTRRLNEKAEARYSIKKGKGGEILFTVQHYQTAFSGGKEQVNKLPTFVRVQWPDGADMPVGMREFIGLLNRRHDTPAYMASKILDGLKREGFELEPPDDPSCRERGQGVCEVQPVVSAYTRMLLEKALDDNGYTASGWVGPWVKGTLAHTLVHGSVRPEDRKYVKDGPKLLWLAMPTDQTFSLAVADYELPRFSYESNQYALPAGATRQVTVPMQYAYDLLGALFDSRHKAKFEAIKNPRRNPDSGPDSTCSDEYVFD
ncbi:MAG: hypothetical protein EBU84_16420, partial [Actinobacteria bacterium]|nr:hypothetical protein [Actinomycetota bacterium]